MLTFVKMVSNKASEEQIRSISDYDFDFKDLKEAAKKDIVKEIRFYTEIDRIKNELTGEKFKEMAMYSPALRAAPLQRGLSQSK